MMKKLKVYNIILDDIINSDMSRWEKCKAFFQIFILTIPIPRDDLFALWMKYVHFSEEEKESSDFPHKSEQKRFI